MSRQTPGHVQNPVDSIDQTNLIVDSSGVAQGTAANPFVFQGGNPATIYTDQQPVTASAVALTAQALTNGCTVKAKSTNAGKVFIGGSGVTVTDDGTGSGYPLEAGEAMSFGVTNCSAIYIIGTASDVVYVVGN